MIDELYLKLKELKVSIREVNGGLDITATKGILNEQLLEEIKYHREELINLINAYKDKKETHSVIRKIPTQPCYAVSSSQHRLWILGQMEESNIAYNVPGVYVFEGDLDTAALERAFDLLIDRHEILRTIFREDGQGEVKQFVNEPEAAGFSVRHLDLRNGDRKEEKLKELVQETLFQPFDLSRGPLVRASLYRVEDNKWVLCYVLHHIVGDGWSMGILIKELLLFYKAGGMAELHSLPPLRIQYKDYAAWQQEQLKGEGFEASRQYWLGQLGGELPVLDLPADKSRPVIKTYNGETIFKNINAELSQGIKLLSGEQGGTLFIELLTVVYILLFRYTQQKDIIIGSPIAGREHADLEDQIGFYINTLAFRARFNGADNYRELSENVKQMALEAYEHQGYPFDELIDILELTQDPSRSALFDVMVVLQNAGNSRMAETQGFGDIRVSGYGEDEFVVSRFDLKFSFIEAGDEIRTGITYNSDIYSRPRIERMAEHLVGLIAAIIQDPSRPIDQLDYFSQAEKRQLTRGFNFHEVAYPKDRTLVDLFADQAALTPDNIAVVSGEKTLTYGELDRLSDRLANRLRMQSNIRPDNMVGIMLDKSESQIIAMLGILKSGGAYVAIDADNPPARKEFIINDTGIKALITQPDHCHDLEFYTGDILMADTWLEPADTPSLWPGGVNKPADLAYVVYTSGSTGTPKGVMISHQSVVDYFYGLQDATNIKTCKSFGLVSTIAADLGNTVIFSSLLTGGSLHVFSAADMMNADAIGKQDLDCLKIVPSHWKALQQEDKLVAPRKCLIFGGEQLTVEIIDLLKLSKAVCSVYNHYGPSETTIGKLIRAIDMTAANPMISLGYPFSNTTVYVLDPRFNLSPIGVNGEICIGGDGLARGYLNKEELTAERFIADPFRAGERMYRTGDLGRWLPGGELQFLGRKDDQVKIRGYRVEPGEVERALQGYGSIDSCVVVAAVNKEGEKELVAYIVSKEWVKPEELSKHLSRRLPVYMFPSRYVRLDRLPLMANGKVDKRRLPEAGDKPIASGAEHIGARTPTEAGLVRIWQEILGKGRIGVRDNFFALGGHSLKAMRLASQIHKEFEVRIGLKELFEHMVLEDQGRLIDQARRTLYTSIPAAAEQETYELSSSQRRLWVLSQLEEGSVAYNMPGLYEFRGVVDVDALERAFRSLIARHESLRTVFREDDGGEVRQVILPVEAVVFGIGYQDLRETEGGGSSAEAEGRVQARGSELAGRSGRKAFDLQTGPLLRAELYRTGEERWLFIYVLHHIISDGWSMGVLIKELLLFYNGFARGELYSLAPLRIQYKDYAVWQQERLKGAGFELSRRYWLEQFSGELPVLELAGDRRRPGVKTYQGGTVRRMIGGELGRGLKTLVQERGATLFMGLVSVVKVLLYRYTQQEDIIIGSPVAGREHADLEGQIGCYVNTVALRTRFSGADSFEKLLGKVREVTMGAYEHQGYPFDRLVEELSLPRDMSRNPLFDVMVVLQNASDALLKGEDDPDGLQVKGYEKAEHVVSKFDISFYFIETGETIGLGIEYNRDIYDRGTVERLAAHWEGLLSAVIGNPAMAVGLADYLGVEEKRELLEEFNATAAEYPRDKTITSLFEEQVGRTPERRALVYEDRMLTYRELNERSNALGNYLRRRHGIGAGDLVGLQLDRSEWLVIAILGVLKAGGAYVPIDPGYPAERIEYMIKDSGCKVVVDQGELGRFRSEAEWWDGRNVSGGNEPTDLLYVLYTSGSTGRPKGCMLEHRGVVNRLWWMWCHYGFSGEDLILQKTTYTFDVSVWELLLPLCWGAGMVICSGEDVQSPERIVSLIERWGVTCVHFVPGMLQAFISNLFKGEGIGERLRSVRQVIASGEALASSTVREWYAGVGIALDNLYGPTEASVDVSWHATKATETKIPIGRPIWNTRLYILDDGSQVVPLGVTGEIYIGGVGVGRGYLNKGELTAEKFMVDPFCSGGRMYRTGDMGRWLSGGEIEFVGRRDGQVKIRGYRIEVGEIEAVLSGYAKVLSSAVLAEAGVGGELELRAYVVGREELSVVELRGWLGERVPLYMVPAHFEQVVSLPLTGNGKVDRKGLGSLKGKELGGKAGYVSPRTEVEREVVEVYEEVLKRTGIGIGDDFFVLGGDSIKSIQIVSRLRQRGYELSIGEVLRHPVLEEVSGRVRVISRSIGQGVVEGVIGLSPVQRYFLGGDRGKVDHYNQSVLLRSGERLSAEGLRAALGRLVAHHDALRMVYRCEGGQWVQENLGLEQGYGWEELRMEGGESWFVGECDRVQSGMELGRGPLLRVVLFRGEGQQGDRLLLVVHHLVIDGVSWRIVLEDLSRLYEQYERGEELRLPLKTDPFGYWQGCQEAYGGSVELSKQEEYWWGVEGSAVSEVPVEQAGGSNKMKDMQSCAEGLEEEMTERLQTRCHRAYRTEINDILLTGLVSALREELGMEKVLLTLEGHGREELGAGVDVTRTVGWFTTLYPVVLEAGGDGGLVERLIGVKECLHRVPGKGMGYGLLRYLKGVGYRREPSIRFNYLGEVGPLGGQGEGKFELSGEYHGRTVDGEMERGVLLEVSGMVTGGRLQLRIQYSGAQYSRGRMEGLVKAWRGSLEELIGILSEQEQEQLTPVDLTYKGLSMEQLQKLNKLL